MALDAQNRAGWQWVYHCSCSTGWQEIGHVLVTTADNMGWDNVQLNEVDDIAHYIIARLGSGTAKELRKQAQAAKKAHQQKTKKRLDEK